MAMRSMRARTQHDYVRHVRAFAAFLGRSPDTATAEDVRRFQVHQREHGAGEAVIGGAVSALRFLFGVTLERPDLSRRLVLAPRPRKLPDVLSVEEVARLLEAAPGIKYRTALSVAYGAGLWRRADPRLPEDRRQVVVDELMDARRAVGRALRSDPTALSAARLAVDRAKTALGERGPVWWDDGAPDLTRHLARNTPYADWHAAMEHVDG